ncbi:MAG: hypothetical protein D6798_15190 [Deltaproteobacteria bacterium]|nr:MAG: hypothetical protein D6798_15190 [Deltaproteobacteria bacterium]
MSGNEERSHPVQEVLDRIVADDEEIPVREDVPDPPPVEGIAANARQCLALLGGVAGAAAIARLVSQRTGRAVRARAVREALRHGDVVALGAGFYALPQATELPLLPWLHSRLRRLGPRSVDDLIADILARWPHGDAVAVRAWLTQEPPGITVVDGVARLSRGPGSPGGASPC